VFAGSGDDGRPSREETERKSSTSASPFCNYHLRKREREKERERERRRYKSGWRPSMTAIHPSLSLPLAPRHTTEPSQLIFFSPYFHLSHFFSSFSSFSHLFLSLFCDSHRVNGSCGRLQTFPRCSKEFHPDGFLNRQGIDLLLLLFVFFFALDTNRSS
jgi:hypothetical protein